LGRSFKEDIDFPQFLSSLDATEEEYLNAIRSSIKRSTVFLKRNTSSIFVNGYNRTLLETWRANIDIQFVLDTYACAKYCVGYILKSQGGVSKLLRTCMQDIKKGNFTIRESMQKYANVLINGSEISAQEAAAFLLQIPNTMCSRQDVFINTAKPDERTGILKSKKELDELGDESDEICCKGLIDHYTQRPETLEDICLAEFASMFEFSKTAGRYKEIHQDEEVNPDAEDEAEDEDGQESELINVIFITI
jgi:hypothetical protein